MSFVACAGTGGQGRLGGAVHADQLNGYSVFKRFLIYITAVVVAECVCAKELEIAVMGAFTRR